MQNIQKYYFFRCYRCGEWYYTNKIIKTKKCWKCHHSFQFQKSTKFSKKCSINDAIEIIKELKKRRVNENLLKYVKLIKR
ncbi:MAG: DUF1922 domain-containing protein [Promethearchaeota archaeon]|nr:MAG: DUF1922 domain-containing protein [Candidatus Lokiarchaeota archaeon]